MDVGADGPLESIALAVNVVPVVPTTEADPVAELDTSPKTCPDPVVEADTVVNTGTTTTALPDTAVAQEPLSTADPVVDTVFSPSDAKPIVVAAEGPVSSMARTDNVTLLVPDTTALAEVVTELLS
jgi:hypothetical protein